MASPRDERNDGRNTQISKTKYESLPNTASKFGAIRVYGVGSYGVVQSMKDDVRIVEKKILELGSDRDYLSGSKETAILAHLKRMDPERKFTPRLLGATFKNNVVVSITMTNEGCDRQTLRYGHGIIPCVRTLALHLCKALTFLAKSGVMHNDITPKNVTYSRVDNHFRLVDFGSAEFCDR
ncbi:dual specificity protein kinase CLK1-like, partial [Anneissia japonica]|uniref:dual specificity protein kinase CLK1-like n=1 Tax=Anneissia japonica TaxID=1529436 RepID=UPI0014257746